MQAEYLLNGDWKPSARWPGLLQELRVPTLIISGDRADEVVADAAMEAEIAEVANPLVTFRRVPGAGHCIRREQPRRYYALVDDWLAALDDR